MNTNFWLSNHPRNIWQCQPDLSDQVWQTAIEEAFPSLGLQSDFSSMDEVLMLTLGEARFGPNHWRLSIPKRAYYFLKPLLPRALTRLMRQVYQNPQKMTAENPWPVDDRYIRFLWDVFARVLRETSGQKLVMKSLWPNNQRFSFVLTHDVETQLGVDYVRKVADVEEGLGFRSSFNFVPELYHVDMNIVDELRSRGFEIGIHGLKHDGKLFSSRREFDRRVIKINRYLKEYGAVGFRSPLTHRNPEWMQSLEVEYDLSFFDTDPFEPMPGGTMSIWPFFLGHFVELPYTLVQDYTLTAVLGETSPRIWLKKVDFIEKYHGMALLNSHPDYLREPDNFRIYLTFLTAMKDRNNYWHALPRNVAQWWRDRAVTRPVNELEKGAISIATLVDGDIQVRPSKELKIPESKMIST